MAEAEVQSAAVAAVSRPRVSTVIPAFNARAYLVDCIASVRNQSGQFELEIIVVDDGSTDGTSEIARRHPEVNCIVQPNRGPSAARNAGIAAAGGEFVAFLDADDRWPAGKIAAQLEILQREPRVALVFGDCRQFDSSGLRSRTEFESGGYGAAAWGRGPIVPGAYARLLENNFITTGSVVARRSALEQAQGFAEDLRLVEDLDLWLRMARHNPIAWSDRECLLRRRHDSNISRDAEAVGLAYLEVLARHAATWQPAEARALGVDASRLASREYLHLAELARLNGKPVLAWRHLWRSLAQHPGLHTQWQAIKTAVKLFIGDTRTRA